MKKIILFLALMSLVPCVTEAHTPIIVEKLSSEVVASTDSPEISRAYYGELTGSPHTFEITSPEAFTLFTQILVPDIEGVENSISGIIIKLPEKEGRVTEIARLKSSSPEWESEFEFFGGDSYRQGPMFERELEPGTYRIEVHNAVNEGKYVLVIGKEEVFEIGYFETVKRIAQVKEFFGKSQLMVIQSPFVYVPLLMLVVVGVIIRRRLKAN